MPQIIDDIMTYLLEDMPEPIPAAERTRAWRAQRRAQGRPDTRAVDAALAEAVSFLISLSISAPVVVDAVDLVRVSTIILVRDGYARAHAKAATIDRVRPRPRHDGISSMPSRQPHRTDLLIQPPDNGGAWENRDIEYVRRLAGRTSGRPD